ncbi:hypothetical protein BH24DEI2_BH24DEI2_27570 [soil metagenome]
MLRNVKGKSAAQAASSAAKAAAAPPTDPSQQEGQVEPKVAHTPTGHIVKTLSTMTPEQLDFTRHLAHVLLADLYAGDEPLPSLPQMQPHERPVLFQCGHVVPMYLPTADPYQLQRDLEPYRNGPCLSCQASVLAERSEGAVVWQPAELQAASPELRLQAERRRYSLVLGFVQVLTEMPDFILAAVVELGPELLQVLNVADGDAWLSGPPVLRRLRDQASEDEDEAKSMTIDEAFKKMKRSKTVTTLLMYDLARLPSSGWEGASNEISNLNG